MLRRTGGKRRKGSNRKVLGDRESLNESTVDNGTTVRIFYDVILHIIGDPIPDHAGSPARSVVISTANTQLT
jgi:hypothetical protein